MSETEVTSTAPWNISVRICCDFVCVLEPCYLIRKRSDFVSLNIATTSGTGLTLSVEHG